MTCTWTASRSYSDWLALQGRGDTGLMEHMTRPTFNGVKKAGESIYIRSLNPAGMTVGTTSPCSTGYLAGEACNQHELLNKFLPFHKFCLDDCAIEDVGDSFMMEVGQAQVIAALNTLMPLIYADMIANGTRIISDATPTNAQLADALLRAQMYINAYGGGPGAIVLDLTTAAGAIQGLGALFQPLNLVSLDFTYGPGRPIGMVAGYPVFVSKDNLVDIAPSPDEQVDMIIFARQGYAYASAGEGVGFKITPQEIDGTTSSVLHGCIGYGVIGIETGGTDSNLVVYVTRADS